MENRASRNKEPLSSDKHNSNYWLLRSTQLSTTQQKAQIERQSQLSLILFHAIVILLSLISSLAHSPRTLLFLFSLDYRHLLFSRSLSLSRVLSRSFILLILLTFHFFSRASSSVRVSSPSAGCNPLFKVISKMECLGAGRHPGVLWVHRDAFPASLKKSAQITRDTVSPKQLYSEERTQSCPCTIGPRNSCVVPHAAFD